VLFGCCLDVVVCVMVTNASDVLSSRLRIVFCGLFWFPHVFLGSVCSSSVVCSIAV